MGSVQRRLARKTGSRSRARRTTVSGELLERRELLSLTPASIILTVAGGTSDGNPATAASLDAPQGVAVDSAGDVFIADSSHNIVREVNHATGSITTIAGTGAPGFSGDGGPATAADLWGPVGLALDSAGDLFIADANNIRIREVNFATGIITTVAGSGRFGNSGNGGPATAAEFGYPGSVAVDSAGDLFISDYLDNAVREVHNGIIKDVAGNGAATYNGDGGPATLAALGTPTQIALDSSGDLFIVDSGNHRIREVNLATGFITTVAGNGGNGYAGDGGPATAAALSAPQGLAVDSAGDLLISDTDDQRIREVNATTQIITTLAGNGADTYAGDGGAATAASLDSPQQIAVDSAGDVVLADEYDNRVREVSHATGNIATVAGGGQISPIGDGGPASLATLFAPDTIAFDSAGDMFIADTSDNMVRMVNHATGVITNIAGNGIAGYSGDDGLATAAELWAPSGLAVDSAGNVFIADSGNNRIREVNLVSGLITTVVGTGIAGFDGDGGLAADAEIDNPLGLAVDTAGDLFFADELNGRVREVIAAIGDVITVAGNGMQGYAGDSGSATAAELNLPQSVALDSAGKLYIADTGNNRIREVNLASGLISTIAGTGSAGPLGDGGPATAAELLTPAGIAVDSAGNLWIADSLNARIRVVNLASGVITTLAGSGTAGLAGDGGPASAAELSSPSAVALDSAGDLFVADSGNNRVREVSLISVRTTPNVAVSDRGGIYNGAPFPATATVSEGPSLEGVTPSLSYYSGTAVTGTALAAVPSHAGTYTVVASFAGSTDDTPAQSAPVTFVIAPAPLTITANNASTTYGAQLPALMVSYSGFAGTDSPANLTSQPTVSTTATPASPVSGSPYALAVSGAVDPDYAISYVAGKLTVAAAPTSVAVSASAPSVTLGQSVTLTATVSASPAPDEGTITFASGDAIIGTAPVNSGTATLTTTNVPLGTNVVTASYLDPGGNYAASVVALGPSSPMFTAAGVGNYSGDGGPATTATLFDPAGVAVDSAGDVFIADLLNNVVREVNHTTGIISTVAGTGTFGYNGDDIAATAAELGGPEGLAVDSAGDLFIADVGNRRVREVHAVTGLITTVAGPGGTSLGDNGPATAAELFAPVAVALDAAGDLFIADNGADRIREVNQATGTITTIAGNGSAGYAGDGGPARAAEINRPDDVAVDSSGDVYIADTSNHVVRVVQAGTGTISTIAGTAGSSGFSGDGGPATAAELNFPTGVTVDEAGNVFIADDDNDRIREINATTGTITTVAGTGKARYNGDEVPAVDANLTLPGAVALDSAGNLFIADTQDDRVREVNQVSQVITTVAGSSYLTVPGNGGMATAASLDVPQAVATDSAGNLYIADSGDNVVREVNHVTGIITTVAGTGIAGATGNGGAATAAELDYPAGLAVDSAGDVFIADSGNNVVREVNHATGMITLVAGSGTAGYNGPAGAATAVDLHTPLGLALDSAGDLFIVDEYNNVIRELPAGANSLITVAGNGVAGYSGDGSPATAAQLDSPQSVAVDSSGNLYIVDRMNEVIREVNAGTHVITTVAGNGTAGFAGDGGPASAAEFLQPTSIALDSAGDLFIVDFGNGCVREVDRATGLVATIAGGGFAIGGDGGPGSAAALMWPIGDAVDAFGNLYVTDTYTNDVRELGSGALVDVTPGLHAPSVTSAVAVQNGQSTSGLVITLAAQDLGTATDFQITNITGGTLYLSDGVTPVSNGEFITLAAGAAGLKFSPTENSNSPGSFDVQASVTANAAGLGGGIVTAAIDVTVVPPASSVGVLDYRTSDPDISVSWSGTPGSGGDIASYNVLVSTDGGAFMPWLSKTTATSAMFSVQTGHTYGFISQATDAAGNTEPLHVAADTTVTVTPTPWQNPTNPLDVLGQGGAIVPQDALLLIDYLNQHPGGGVLPTTAAAGSYYYDVLGTNDVVPADALAVINYLNTHPAAPAVAAEVNALPASAAAPAVQPDSVGNSALANVTAAPDGALAAFAAAAGTESAASNVTPQASPALLAAAAVTAADAAKSFSSPHTDSSARLAISAASPRSVAYDSLQQQAADRVFADASASWWDDLG